MARRRQRSETPSAEWQAVQRAARTHFGIEEFRPGQAEVIRAVIAGRDVLAMMPTGAGKSLCYQIPGLRRTGTTVVVSPLISLMRDQAEKLALAGVPTAEIHSALRKSEVDEAHATLGEGAEFVLVSPERLTQPEFLEGLRGHTIDLIVVDEAHCVSQWGHDFRPAYLSIRDAIAALGRPPVLALTATATPEVARDIVTQLTMRDVVTVDTGTFRPNLHYEVIPVDREDAKTTALLGLLRSTPGPGIVYCASVRHVEELAALTEAEGLPSVRYHAKLGARLRHEHQARFMGGDAPVMIATNAFGMGIDKPDIRFVVHYDLPPSLDAYYQESGRAGRDGEDARCVLIYHRPDRRTPIFFMSGRYPTADDLRSLHATLSEAGDAALGLREIQDRTEIARGKVRVGLTLLKDAGAVRELRGSKYRLARATLTADDVAGLAGAYEERRDADRERLARMEAYAQTGRCRWQAIAEYFSGEAPPEPCGTCDNCQRGTARVAHEAAATLTASDPAPAVVTLLRGGFVEVEGLGRAQVQEIADEHVVVSLADGASETVSRDRVRVAP